MCGMYRKRLAESETTVVAMIRVAWDWRAAIAVLIAGHDIMSIRGLPQS